MIESIQHCICGIIGEGGFDPLHGLVDVYEYGLSGVKHHVWRSSLLHVVMARPCASAITMHL
jgi:hypothetical protein